jgi:L-cysteine desulfidase
MAHEILSVKLCELEDQLSRLSSRIYLSETADHQKLEQEIKTLSQEYQETELTLKKKLAMSKAKLVTILANTYTEIEPILKKAKQKLKTQANNQQNSEAMAENKILLAEYALDFAIQAANQALLLALQAIDAQLQQERSPQ